MKKELRIGGALLTLVALAGCSTVNQFLGKEESIDYRSASPQRDGGLAVPPDLTQVAPNLRYQIPGSPGGTSYSEYASEQAMREALARGQDASRVLPQRENMRIERDGANRWLVVYDKSAEDVFEEALEFWRSEGFTIRSQNAQAGLIETDWAENRAKIPQDLLRRTLGRVIDLAWDTGEREFFRTRLERAPDGAIEVYITHQKMVEEVISEAQTKWVPGDQDPELDAAMLARFMVFLGAHEDRAKLELERTQRTEAVSQSGPSLVQGSGAEGRLEIAEPFDRAWRRVGLALDRGNFTVEDRDRTAGEYYVRYFDIDAEQGERAGWLRRVFGASTPKEQPQYRVVLRELGGSTQVTVVNAEGQRDTSPTAGRILDVLREQLRD